MVTIQGLDHEIFSGIFKGVNLRACMYQDDDPAENLPNVLITTMHLITEVSGNNFPTL